MLLFFFSSVRLAISDTFLSVHDDQSVALALSIPVVCVITKIDMTPPNVTEQTLKQLVKILKSPGCRKTPVFVKDIGMSCELASSFLEEK